MPAKETLANKSAFERLNKTIHFLFFNSAVSPVVQWPKMPPSGISHSVEKGGDKSSILFGAISLFLLEKEKGLKFIPKRKIGSIILGANRRKVIAHCFAFL